MTLQELEQTIAPIPAEVFSKTMERLLLVDARLAIEAKREQVKNAMTVAQADAQQEIETLTAQINGLQSQIDAL